MTRADEAVIIARRWIGTPYLHQATCEGAGCDCLGLIRGVWRELYGREPEAVPAYSADWAEPQRVEALFGAARRWLIEKNPRDVAVGDVVLFRMRAEAPAKHLAIQSMTGPSAQIVHAYERHGVVESPLSAPWARRIVGRFAFPEEFN